ncbi:MAG: hypothetical protein AB1813_24815 [Verrucomicrobiota bacterium]
MKKILLVLALMALWTGCNRTDQTDTGTAPPANTNNVATNAPAPTP